MLELEDFMWLEHTVTYDPGLGMAERALDPAFIDGIA